MGATLANGADALRVGVLGLQGDFREHIRALARLGVPAVDVRLPEDLAGTAGLIVPGGESTTLRKLLAFSGLDDAIRARAAAGYALYGTCAGMILLAGRILNDPDLDPLCLIDIAVDRNAYGRQIDSFEAPVNVRGLGEIRAVFIRAPRLSAHGPDVEVLARHAGVPVMARQGRVLVSSFHPELGDDLRVHDYFVRELCRSPAGTSARR